jgi:regulatory protein
MEENQFISLSVEKIARFEGKNGKFKISLSDGTNFNVSSSQIVDFDLYSGRELSYDEFSELIVERNVAQAKSSVLKILGNRSLSTAEVRKRLVSKGETEEIAESVTDWLLELGLLDDGQYARSIVEHYCSKGYGPLRLKDEMYKRGIPSDMQNEVLSELSDEDIEAAADGYLEKKLNKGQSSYEDLKRAINALYRRGFSYEQADIAIKKHKEKHSEDD